MPIQLTEEQQIVDGDAVYSQPINPPATVAQQAQVPAYANDVYQGPSTFKTFTGYQSAWERARDEAMAQRAQDAQLREVLANSTAVEDQLKAIQQAKQFVQMRKFGSDLQAAIASGLPPEQALAPALARNPGVLLGNMASSVSAFRNAGRSMQPQVPLGETKVILDPETGKRIGIAVRLGDGSMQFRPDVSSKITPSQRLGALRTKADIISEQIKNMSTAESIAASDPNNKSSPKIKLAEVMSDIDKIIANEKPVEIPAPATTASPVASPVQTETPTPVAQPVQSELTKEQKKKQRYDLARRLEIENPNYTAEQIKEIVFRTIK